MTDQTENPTPSAQDDIKSVLQDTLFQQVDTLLKFTRTDTLQLQIPKTDIHIFAGPRTRIAEFIQREIITPAASFGASAGITPEYKAAQQEANAAASAGLAALASQSQAAQPTIQPWQERTETRAMCLPLFEAMKGEIADLRAHLAGQSQAVEQPRAQAKLAGGEIGSVEDINRIWTAMPASLCNEPFVKSLYRSAIAGAIVADSARQSQATKAQAEPKFQAYARSLSGMSEVKPEHLHIYDHHEVFYLAHDVDTAGSAQAEPVGHVVTWNKGGSGEVNSIEPIGKSGDSLAASLPEGTLIYIDAPVAKEAPAVPDLTVWYGPMPESNGKLNFTATLMRKGASMFDTDSYTFARSEYPDRVRYEADSMRYLIGELKERPCVLDYDTDKHSGYAAPVASVAKEATKEAETGVQANVLPPFAAPASQHDAHGEVLSIERIGQLIDKHTDRDFGLIVEPFARDIEEEVVRRFGAQGGITNDSGSDLAPTTSTVSAPADQAETASSTALDIIRTMLFAVDQFTASGSPDEPAPWALNSPVVLAARRLCREYGYETGDFLIDSAAMTSASIANDPEFCRLLTDFGLASHRSIDKARSDLVACIDRRAPSSTEGAQKAPEEVRNQALEEAVTLAIKFTAVPRDVLGPPTVQMKTLASVGEKLITAIRALKRTTSTDTDGSGNG